jgi:4-amino-4-deoxy-L-arabinose transferase-like glycosyltransferase
MKEFVTAVGSIGWEADAQGLKVTFRRRTRQLRWADVTAAGLVHLPSPAVPPDMPTSILPGLGKVIDVDRRLAREQRQLVLARGRSAFQAMRLPIPVDEPEAMALVEAVRRNLDDRWIGEVSMEDHQSALGLSTPWWFYPLFGLGMAILGLAILLAIGAFQALSSGQVSGVPPIAWLALLLWLILIGGILFIYRRRR